MFTGNEQRGTDPANVMDSVGPMTETKYPAAKWEEAFGFYELKLCIQD